MVTVFIGLRRSVLGITDCFHALTTQGETEFELQ